MQQGGIIITLLALAIMDIVAGMSGNTILDSFSQHKFILVASGLVYLGIALGYIFIRKNNAPLPATPASSVAPASAAAPITPDEEVIEMASAMYMSWVSRLKQDPPTGMGGTREHYLDDVALFFSCGQRSMIRIEGQRELLTFYQQTGQTKPLDYQLALVVMYGVIRDQDLGRAARLVVELPRQRRLAIAHLEDLVNRNGLNRSSESWDTREAVTAALRAAYKPDHLMIP